MKNIKSIVLIITVICCALNVYFNWDDNSEAAAWVVATAGWLEVLFLERKKENGSTT